MATEDTIILQAERREAGGSGEARRVRAAGKIPVVVYGEGHHHTLQVNAHDFSLMLQRHGEHQILDLVLDGQSAGKVLVQDVQHDVRSGLILHADLEFVSMDREIHLSLPLKLAGDAIGLKAGGVVELVIDEIEIACLPGDVVEEITVDISKLDIGDNLTVADVALPPGVRVLSDPDMVLITMASPTVEAAETEEGAAGAEPAQQEKAKA